MLDPAFLCISGSESSLGNGNDDVLRLDQFFLAFFGRYVEIKFVHMIMSSKRTGAGRPASLRVSVFFEGVYRFFVFPKMIVIRVNIF